MEVGFSFSILTFEVLVGMEVGGGSRLVEVEVWKRGLDETPGGWASRFEKTSQRLGKTGVLAGTEPRLQKQSCPVEMAAIVSESP